MSAAATPSTPLNELLALYALHLTDPAESLIVENAVAADPAVAAELASLRAMLDGMLVTSRLVNPARSVRGRLLASATHVRMAAVNLPAVGRFEAFVLRLATMFDISAMRACEVLASIDDRTRWSPAVAPGIDVLRFAAGPACAGAETSLVRVAAGRRFPEHTHIGDARALVLSGCGLDDHGGSFAVGAETVFAAGSRRSFVAGSDGELIYAVRSTGVRFDA